MEENLNPTFELFLQKSTGTPKRRKRIILGIILVLIIVIAFVIAGVLCQDTISGIFDGESEPLGRSLHIEPDFETGDNETIVVLGGYGVDGKMVTDIEYLFQDVQRNCEYLPR